MCYNHVVINYFLFMLLFKGLINIAYSLRNILLPLTPIFSDV